MWRLAVASGAARSLSRLPKADQERISAAFEVLQRDPFEPVHSRRLQPWRDRRRWRVGDYRILYTLDRQARVVIVNEILRRTSTTY